MHRQQLIINNMISQYHSKLPLYSCKLFGIHHDPYSAGLAIFAFTVNDFLLANDRFAMF